jgi:hypothetical protein
MISGHHCINIKAWTPQSTRGGGGIGGTAHESGMSAALSFFKGGKEGSNHSQLQYSSRIYTSSIWEGESECLVFILVAVVY